MKVQEKQEKSELNLTEYDHSILWYFRKQKLGSLREFNSLITSCFDINILKQLLETAMEEKLIYSESMNLKG